jgi:phosphoglycerate dehydrogenase-like enzyme
MRIVIRALHGTAPLVSRVQALVGNGVTLANDDTALAANIDDAELLLVTDNLYSAEVAGLLRTRAAKLKWIQLLSAGYDAVAQHGVPPGVAVTNAGDAYAPSVAAHAVALLLSLQRQVPIFLASQARHHWERGRGAHNTLPFETTIAIVGFGHIGREMARLLQSFGARIIAVTRRGTPHPEIEETVSVADLRSILPRVDAVMIALAASPETRHLIGAAELHAMKRSAFLVNIARGYVVDCIALAAALRDGSIAGAGIDVTEPEPLPGDHPLWDAPNLILTPHMAGASGEVTGRRVAKVVGDNLERYLTGQSLLYRVAL